ncbi:MAG: hypothetical protein ACRES7_10850 [Gammaproteobacteria bacterium]
MIGVIIFLWIVAIIVGTVIGDRKGQPVLAFILCLFLSWLGVLFVALSQNKLKTLCPHCREPVMKDATVCPHCRYTLEQEEPTPENTCVIFKEGRYLLKDTNWTTDLKVAWRVDPKSDMIRRIAEQVGGQLLEPADSHG